MPVDRSTHVPNQYSQDMYRNPNASRSDPRLHMQDVQPPSRFDTPFTSHQPSVNSNISDRPVQPSFSLPYHQRPAPKRSRLEEDDIFNNMNTRWPGTWVMPPIAPNTPSNVHIVFQNGDSAPLPEILAAVQDKLDKIDQLEAKVKMAQENNEESVNSLQAQCDEHEAYIKNLLTRLVELENRTVPELPPAPAAPPVPTQSAPPQEEVRTRKVYNPELVVS